MEEKGSGSRGRDGSCSVLLEDRLGEHGLHEAHGGHLPGLVHTTDPGWGQVDEGTLLVGVGSLRELDDQRLASLLKGLTVESLDGFLTLLLAL